MKNPTSTRTEVRSPTSTRTEVRSPTSTSTKATTTGNKTSTSTDGSYNTTTNNFAGSRKRAKIRRANPQDVRKAVALYTSFREKKPRKIRSVTFNVPRVAAVIGYIESIDYKTTHGKKTVLYRHDFVSGSRPLLCTSANGRQLLLLGGRYKFTRRGIVDRDAKGREIDESHKGEFVD